MRNAECNDGAKRFSKNLNSAPLIIDVMPLQWALVRLCRVSTPLNVRKWLVEARVRLPPGADAGRDLGQTFCLVRRDEPPAHAFYCQMAAAAFL